jgi:serine/threonine-protein kinase
MREPVKSEPSSALPRVGRYEILLDLQDEGFVSLMVAKVRGPNAGPRIVELSRVERSLARAVEVKEAFLAEARAAGRVRHENFVPPIDTLAHEGDLYSATEFSLGARLDELWRAAAAERYEIPLPISLRIILDVLSGLSALHASGANTAASRPIVHGDIAPTNIFIADTGETRVVHSGLSLVTSRAGAIGRRNHRLAYKAPEQLLTGVNAVPIDPTADVFAVGVLLWEMLQGTRLFDDPSDVEVVEHILYGQIPHLEPGGTRYMPIALLPLVANALERNPDVRTPNATTLADDIERAPGVRIASPEEVAAVVEQLMGPQIERRRSLVEELMARTKDGPTTEGSIRPVVGPQRRSMRTPVGFVYPPPSSSPPPSSPRPPSMPSYELSPDALPPSYRAPDSRTYPPSPRTPLHNRLPARTPSTSGRLPPISRTPSVTGRYPARTPSTSGRAPISSRPGVSRDERGKRASGGSWAYYLTIGAIAGIVIFSIVRVLANSSTSSGPPGPPESAAAPPVTPVSPPGQLPAAKAPGIEEAPRPIPEPTAAPAPHEGPAQPKDIAAASASASPSAGAPAVPEVAAPEGPGGVAPNARPARPATKAAPKSEIPAGI